MGHVQLAPPDAEAAGKALRARVPRTAHGKLPHHHRDPIGILMQADANRLPELVPIRYGRMMQSPFAFFRGSAGVMAADLAHTPATGLMVQVCGDCHLKNFGGFATPERNIVFDINDFDETLHGAWEWDIKRLVASFVLAVRENGLSEDAGREAALACARSYRKAMRAFAKTDPLGIWYTKLYAADLVKTLPLKIRARAQRRLEKATTRRGSDIDYPKLAEVVHGELRIRDNPPLIYHPDIARAPKFKDNALEILNAYRESLPDDRRVLFDRYRFVDAAIKVVGVGSVGTRCWIVLMLGSDESDPLFLQVKEAERSVLSEFAGPSKYDNQGQRVVVGQRYTQASSDIFLGWIRIEEGIDGHPHDYYVRQLRDWKVSLEIERMSQDWLRRYASYCGWTLARAHARTGDRFAMAGYLGSSA
ncbi:MAG: DUF2252 domain-containing protein, partial [Candidatus Eremiobacteraeota bacterium]|nr:DUF2252 domain-containing protein [Candidatus Eremiobacteraeota bacterium]